MKYSNHLSSNSFGRILLHLGCGLRRPSHWSWHWQGVRRELQFTGMLNGATALCLLLLTPLAGAQTAANDKTSDDMRPLPAKGSTSIAPPAVTLWSVNL
jgi:hypothetical protein